MERRCAAAAMHELIMAKAAGDCLLVTGEWGGGAGD